jgi:hypothetical protein
LYLYRLRADGGDNGKGDLERWFEGKSAVETTDGRILYIKDGRPGLFARSMAGDPKENPEERLVEDIRGPVGYFAPVAEGVYYTAQDAHGNIVALRFFDYARKTITEIAPRSVTGGINSLTVTPDRSRLIYTQTSRDDIDLTLIEFP